MTGAQRLLHALFRLPALVLVGLIRAYQLLVSPLLGPVCRYAPSCSSYAVQAVQRHGAVRGTWLAGRRLLRCHPWAPGGWDPVPAARTRTHPHPEPARTP